MYMLKLVGLLPIGVYWKDAGLTSNMSFSELCYMNNTPKAITFGDYGDNT